MFLGYLFGRTPPYTCVDKQGAVHLDLFSACWDMRRSLPWGTSSGQTEQHLTSNSRCLSRTA